MAEVVRAGRKPVTMMLAPGDYFYCRCGRSSHQPFCDGAHKGTGITPLAFRIDRQQECKLCLCKQTQTPPFCDESHHDLD